MIEVQSPKDYSKIPVTKQFVFLGGSIEMGVAEPWQRRLCEIFKDYDNVVFLNPRRDDWDSSWVQSKDNKQFAEQVTWELDALEYSDIIIFYFDPNTKSPITLMELGLHANYKSIVCCPDGFWRKGNVEMVCDYYRIPMVNTFEQLTELLKQRVLKYGFKY